MRGLRMRREVVFLAVAVLLAAAAGLVLYLSRATTLTVAVAPSGGTEPALLRAYAEALARQRKAVRLKILPFDGVRESAEALQAGRADLAVVRPDVLMPGNGLTLAILREQALVVAGPEGGPVRAFPDLARRRLGILAERTADWALIREAIVHQGFGLLTEASAGPVPPRSVALVPVAEGDLAKAFAERRIDAVALVTTPTTPAARRAVALVREAGRGRRPTLLGVPDPPALLARLPRLQAVTIPAGLYGGNPRIPEEDLATVGASYRLMARETLSRSLAAEVTENLFEMRSALSDAVPAANLIAAPAYDTTAAATSARLPIHPGAIDYFEREQESFIERYETWIYLLAFLGGGLGSGFAWLRQRLSRLRRERIEIATERLLEIRGAAGRTTDPARLAALADEIDALAANIARFALNRPAEPRTMSAAGIAIDAARSTVRRALEQPGSPQAGSARPGPDRPAPEPRAAGKDLVQGLGRGLRAVD
ncbi:TAXI family TRAP transporter solute-binding subunit [Methylobacterium sp. A54F]